MTQSEFIEMANEAGIIHPQMVITHLEAFAKLVAVKKQEDIIKTIESFGTWAYISEIVNEVRGQA